jgi:hypothetical protein
MSQPGGLGAHLAKRSFLVIQDRQHHLARETGGIQDVFSRDRGQPYVAGQIAAPIRGPVLENLTGQLGGSRLDPQMLNRRKLEKLAGLGPQVFAPQDEGRLDRGVLNQPAQDEGGLSGILKPGRQRDSHSGRGRLVWRSHTEKCITGLETGQASLSGK